MNKRPLTFSRALQFTKQFRFHYLVHPCYPLFIERECLGGKGSGPHIQRPTVRILYCGTTDIPSSCFSCKLKSLARDGLAFSESWLKAPLWRLKSTNKKEGWFWVHIGPQAGAPKCGEGGCLRVDIGGEEEGTVSSLLPPCWFPSLFGRTSSGPGRGGRGTAKGCGTPPPLNSTPSGIAAHSPNLWRAFPTPSGAFRRQPAPPPTPRPKTAQAQILAGAENAPSCGELTARTLCCCAGGCEEAGGERCGWGLGGRCDNQITTTRFSFLCLSWQHIIPRFRCRRWKYGLRRSKHRFIETEVAWENWERRGMHSINHSFSKHSMRWGETGTKNQRD